jgi:hypothetical protein
VHERYSEAIDEQADVSDCVRDRDALLDDCVGNGARISEGGCVTGCASLLGRVRVRCTQYGELRDSCPVSRAA